MRRSLDGLWTPFCLVPRRGRWGWTLLAVVWAIALVGLLVRMGWRGAPQWGSVVLYLMRGWFCAATWELLARTPPGRGQRDHLLAGHRGGDAAAPPATSC